MIFNEDHYLQSFPIWLNADILPGPGVSHATVDAPAFLSACAARAPERRLSLGWTTANCPSSFYSDAHADAMLAALASAGVRTRTPLTYAVRACLLQRAGSRQPLRRLLSARNRRDAYLTVWSGGDDGGDVDAAGVADAIRFFTVSKVFLDVPAELEEEIRKHL